MQHMEERELEVKRYWNEVSDSEWYRSLRTEERLDRLQKDPKTAFYPGVLELMAKHVGDFRGKKILLPSSGDNHAAFAFALMGAQVTSADISERQLENAGQISERWNLDIEYICDDTTRLSKFGDGTFELTATAKDAGTGAEIETQDGDWWWYSSDPKVLEVANAQGSGTMTITVKGAGTAMIMAWYEPTGDNHQEIGAAMTEPITVSKRSLTVTAAGKGEIYVGGEVPTLPDGPAAGADYSLDGLVDGDSLSGVTLAYSPAADNTKPGTYAVVPSGATVKRGETDVSGNYAISYVNGEFKVKPKETQTISAADMEVTFGDTGKSIDASVTAPAEPVGSLSYAIKSGGDCIAVDATTGALTIKKAGTASVTVTASETDTCAQASKDVSVTIDKAETAPATVTASGWTYDTTERRLVYAEGAVSGGVMQYAVGDGAETAPTSGWGASIPTATNAGTYYVWYKVRGDENHNDTKAQVVKDEHEDAGVYVGKADPPGDAPGPLSATVGDLLESVKLPTAANGTWSWTEDPGRMVEHAGECYFEAMFTPKDTTNYNAIEGVYVVVNAAKGQSSVTANPKGRALTYNGGDQALVTAGTAEGGTMEYSLDGEVFTEGVPVGVGAGDYTVWYMVAGDEDHNDTEPQRVTSSIAKAAPAVTAPKARQLTYSGKAQPLVAAGSTSGGAMQYSLDGKAWSKEIPTGTDVGAYTVWYKVFGDANHNDTEAESVKVTVYKTSSSVKVAPKGLTLTHNGKPQALVTPGTAEGGTMRYSLDGKSWSEKVPTGTAAKEYTVWYKVVGDADHKDTAPASVKATIRPRTYRVIVAKTANGVVSVSPTTARAGQAVRVTAAPALGYELSAVTARDASGRAIKVTNGAFAMPASDVTVSATFLKSADPAKALVPGGSGHVQTYGDVAVKASGRGIRIGTTGESKRLEAVSVSLPAGVGGSIEYCAHVQRAGWVGWERDGSPCGTTGEARRVEAVRMRLSGAVAGTHSVWYRAHSQTFGWLGWAKDGEGAGTAGLAKRAEAVDVQVLPKGQTPAGRVAGQASFVGAAVADTHLQRVGWTGTRSALEFGTTGEARRLEALSVTLPNQPEAGGVSYQAHVQSIGWQRRVSDGDVAGTTGRAKRVEAVRLWLTGDMAAKYSVWYRAHSQTYGWLGWAKDGADAGTTGLAKRVEALDVQVLPKGQVPAGYDAGRATCVLR